jgi:hypothetical protein
VIEGIDAIRGTIKLYTYDIEEYIERTIKISTDKA